MIIPRAAEGLPPNPHGHELANVAIIMCVIAGVLVLGRLATRIFLQRSTGWDDYTLVASLGLAIGITVCYTQEVYYGMGLHTKEVHNKHYKQLAFTWLWIAQLLYKFANGMTKISIVLLYLRIFPTRKFKLVSYAVIAFVVAYCTAAICTSIWQCDPIEKAWKKSEPGKCIDIGILWYVNSAMTITADLILIAMPIRQIVRLKLPLSQKLGLVLIFSLGGFVIACTIVRLVALGPTVSKKDSLYYQASSNSWTFLEVDVSIICASLPVLKAPISRLFPRVFGTNKGTKDNTHTGPFSHVRGRSGNTINMKNWNEQQDVSEGTTVTGGPREDDTASDEEKILDYPGIMKTTEVNVDYEDMARDSSRSEEDIGSGMNYGTDGVRRHNLPKQARE